MLSGMLLRIWMKEPRADNESPLRGNEGRAGWLVSIVPMVLDVGDGEGSGDSVKMGPHEMLVVVTQELVVVE